MRTLALLGVCILIASLANAQTSTTVPKKPGASNTLVVKPRKPQPPPPPPPKDSNCIPGATCVPGTPPDSSGAPVNPGSGDSPRRGDVVPGAIDAPAEVPGAGGASTPGARSGMNVPDVPNAPAANGNRLRELLVASVDVPESDAQRAWFAQQGIGVLRRRVLPNLGYVLTVYRIPPGTDLPSLLAAFTAQWPNSAPETNQRYLPLAAPSAAPARYATALVGLPERGCTRPVRIAMLDGPVNLGLPGFAARVHSIDIAERGKDPAYAHGTGIAALLLGAGDSPGLLPHAQLLAANVFARQGERSYTTTEWILRGLDWVLGEKPVPGVVNLSFGGPESAQLARAIQRVQEHARVVAAAGNDGAARPVYPAAYPGVIAVSAVDARRRRWSRSNAGEFVAIAAPGVDVWTVDGEGRGYYANGTSFAAVYVSAAVALGAPEQAALATWLSLHAEDLGVPGRDRLFGFGLLRAGDLCP